MTDVEPSSYVTCGSLHELTRPDDWDADRPVWIQSTGGSLKRCVYADHLERGGDGGQALVLRSWGPGETPTVPVVLLEWAAAATGTIPTSSFHRSLAGARARITAEAARLGVDAAAAQAAEEVSPGGRFRTGQLGSGASYLLQILQLEE